MPRHHYVPQFILKKWFNNKDCIYYYTLNNNKFREFKLSSTKKIFEKKNLYQAFEKQHFAKIDTIGSEIIYIFENNILLNEYISPVDKLLTKEKRDNFTMFVTSLTGRHPRSIKKHKNTAKIISDRFLSYNHPFKDRFEASGHIEALALRSGYISDIAPDLSIDASPMLPELNWYLINFSKSKFKLIITDQPITLIINNLENTRPPRNINECLESGASLFLPINPNLGWIATHSQPEIKNINFHAKFFNQLQLTKNYNEVCSSASILNFLNKYSEIFKN